MLLFVRQSLIFFLLMATAFSSLAASRWQQPSYLITAFTEVALRNEYSQRGHVVRRWNQPIKVWLDHQVGDKELHTELVRMHIEHLSSLTKHPIEFVKTAKQANLTIVFTRQKEWKSQVGRLFGKRAESVVQGAVCMANFRVNGRYEIKEAGVVIPVDQARMHGKLVTCVVEEITQVMGLPNDSDRVYPSIFNDNTPENLLSGLDGLLLRMLYSEEVKNGMTENEVKPVLRRLIARWQQDGTIQSATRDVKRGELYPLLGY